MSGPLCENCMPISREITILLHFKQKLTLSLTGLRLQLIAFFLCTNATLHNASKKIAFKLNINIFLTVNLRHSLGAILDWGNAAFFRDLAPDPTVPPQRSANILPGQPWDRFTQSHLPPDNARIHVKSNISQQNEPSAINKHQFWMPYTDYTWLTSHQQRLSKNRYGLYSSLLKSREITVLWLLTGRLQSNRIN